MDEIDITNYAGDNTPYVTVDDIDEVKASLMLQYQVLKKRIQNWNLCVLSFSQVFFQIFEYI